MDGMGALTLIAIAAAAAVGGTFLVAALLRKLTANIRLVRFVSAFAIPVAVFAGAALLPSDPHGFTGTLAFLLAASLIPVTAITSDFATRRDGQGKRPKS